MPLYEPVIRHEHAPFATVCSACGYGIGNTPCDKPWCECFCRVTPGPVALEDLPDDPDPITESATEPVWQEPPAKPEPLGTWAPGSHGIEVPIGADITADLKRRRSHAPAEWTSPPPVDDNRIARFVYDYLPVAGILVAIVQMFALYLVVSRDTDGTWAEAYVIVSSVVTAAFALASTVRPRRN